MKNYYNVTFKWSAEGNTYCTNLAIAENEESIKKHYEEHEIICIRPASESDIEEAQRKGMPIVTCATVEAPTEALQIKDLLIEVMENAQEEAKGYYADLENYNEGYINDIISEIADNNTSIYYSVIMDFIRKNPESLAEVVAEGLYEVGHGQEYDLFKHGQAAEYMTISNAIYNDIDNMLLWYSLKYFAQYSDTITEEQFADMESNARYNQIDTLEEITESIDLLFAEE